MDFREREIDFRDADRRYAELRRQLDEGTLSPDEFDTQRRRLMVQDDEGRWWAKSRTTGEWNYHDGNTWVRGTPPGYQRASPETTVSSSASTSPDPHPKGTKNREDARQRVQPWALLAVGLVGIALVAVALVFWMLVPYLRGEDDVASETEAATIPDVVSMSQEEAEETLRSARFEVKAETQESSEEDEGIVLTQEPSGGSEAENSSTVAITVGEGPPPEEEAPKEEEAPEPASDYTSVEDYTGALSVEVPSGWGSIAGKDSEGAGSNWSSYAGESIESSITAAPDLAAWHSALGAAGTYIVASRELAQEYTDDELLTLDLNDYSSYCEPGLVEGFDRPPYSGRMQTWNNCGGPGAVMLTLAAAPENRECVVLLQIRTTAEARQRILDTFEVDCKGIA